MTPPHDQHHRLRRHVAGADLAAVHDRGDRGTPPADFAPPATTTTTTTPPATTTPTTAATQVTAAPDVAVPSVVGMSADEATSLLSRSGFVPERVDKGQAGTAGT